jgi:hypothetical protein
MNTLIRIALFLMIPGSSIILVVWVLSRLYRGTREHAS